MIENVLGVLQRLLLQGGTVLLVGVTTWLVVMPRSIREGFAKAGRVAEGAAVARDLGGRAHRTALRLALLLLVGWVLRLPVQLMGFRDPFVPLTDDLKLLLLQTSWGAVWIAQGIVLLLLVSALVVAANLRHGEAEAAPGAGAATLPAADGPAALVPLVLATALVVLGLSLSSHALAVEGSPALAVAADFLHIVAAGMWIGLLAIVLRLRMTAGAPDEAFILQLRRFSVVALGAVPLLILAGVVLGQYHLLRWSDFWQTPYGRILALKIGLAGAAMLLGLVNWRTGIPRIEDVAVRSAIRRRASLEVGIALAVLVLTAVLTGTARPTDAMPTDPLYQEADDSR